MPICQNFYQTLAPCPVVELRGYAAAKGLKTLHAATYREAADALLSRMAPGDALLVKASRGMALEKVLEIFYAEYKKAEE